jgi:hypothetical protein
MSIWDNVTEHDLQLAMDECDHYGLDLFRTRYGDFYQADSLHMYYPEQGTEKGPYEARPLVAAAYAYHCHHQRYLEPIDFQDNDAQKFLVSHYHFRHQFS